jgi:hypothetical protein
LVVLGERPGVNIKALGTGVDDHDVRDGATTVVDGEGDWDSLRIRELEMADVPRPAILTSSANNDKRELFEGYGALTCSKSLEDYFNARTD